MFFANRYQLGKLIGEGGMGAVYEATDHLTGQQVALKRVLVTTEQLTFQSHEEDDLNISLAREFQTLASLRHPHIISVLDYGFDDQRRPYFTMPLLHNAQTITQLGDTLGLDGKVNLLIQVLQALAYLHRRGIVHRDLKPGNILVEGGEIVRVLDFGLAIKPDQSKSIAGTVAYMAPELLQAERPSVASDLYAVGVIAYELLSGIYPYSTLNHHQLMIDIMTLIPDFSKLETTTVRAVDTSNAPETVHLQQPMIIVETTETDAVFKPHTPTDIVRRLLAKDPKTRYQSATEVIYDLCTAIGQPVPPENKAIRESFIEAAAFIGRQVELSTLETALTNALGGIGSAWLIGGESGVGKSRLLDEICIRAMVRGAVVLKGQGVADGGLPFQFWRDPLRRLVLSTDLTDGEASILRPVVSDIEELLQRPIPPTSEKNNIADTIVSIFRRQNMPIVLVLEDLQWATESLEVLKRINEITEDAKLLVLGSYRQDEKPDLPSELPTMQELPLIRLSDDHIAELSRAMLGEGGKAEHIVSLLQRETEGNVYFVVEVVRALAEEAGRLENVAYMTLPQRVFAGGIEKIIQRRLERVPEWGQTLLQLAAVAGRELDLAILECLADIHLPQHGLTTWLLDCADAVVLEVRENRWRFAHDKLRERLLNSLENKAIFHRQVAEAIEKIYPNNAAYAAILTDHWAAAGNQNKERFYARIAGQQAFHTSSYPEALTFFNRALHLLPETNSEADRAALLCSIGRVHLNQSEFEQAQNYLTQGLELARQLDNKLIIADALRALGLVARHLGKLDAAMQFLDESLTISQAIQDRNGESAALQGLGFAHRSRGEFEKSIDYCRQALLIAQELGDAHLESATLGTMGVTHYFLNQFDEAIECSEKALEINRKLGNRRGETSMLNSLGAFAYMLGNLPKAVEYYDQAYVIAQVIGDKQAASAPLQNLASAYNDLGQFDKAIEYFDRSLKIDRAIGNQENIANSLINLSDTYRDNSRVEDAIRTAQEGLQIAVEMDSPQLKCGAGIKLGWAHLMKGEAATARAYFDTAAQIDAPDVNYEAWAGLGVACLLAKDEAAARHAFTESIARTKAAIEETEGIFATWFNLGLTYAGLSMIDGATVEQAVEAYQKGRELANYVGILESKQRQLKILGGDFSAIEQVLSV